MTSFWLFLLVSCGPALITSQQTVNGLTIAFERQERPQVNAEQEYIVKLTDAAGQPVTGALVTLDLTMLAHPMGKNQPIAEELGAGRYRVRTVATMDGRWSITVSALVGGQERRAVFEQEVAAP